jgi:hypothetical protein
MIHTEALAESSIKRGILPIDRKVETIFSTNLTVPSINYT